MKDRAALSRKGAIVLEESASEFQNDDGLGFLGSIASLLRLLFDVIVVSFGTEKALTSSPEIDRNHANVIRYSFIFVIFFS
mmetsp:Transcript_39781/g.96048  ORF Transcript_39781/g.96048 Transcript_39781/m.96048 type:complete len:81 (-) Transcript_39781:79-321(-)